jgi:nucleotide-binding universal stress UspA family protein
MSPKILLASRLPDGPDPTALAAARLARQIGGELILVYVVVELSTLPALHLASGEDPDLLRKRVIAEVEARAEDYLQKHLEGIPSGVWLVEGDVAEAITRVAREQGADYLVIGTEGRSMLRQVILGSTSQKILHRAPCPVLVVPQIPA